MLLRRVREGTVGPCRGRTDKRSRSPALIEQARERRGFCYALGHAAGGAAAFPRSWMKATTTANTPATNAAPMAPIKATRVPSFVEPVDVPPRAWDAAGDTAAVGMLVGGMVVIGGCVVIAAGAVAMAVDEGGDGGRTRG